MILSQLPFAKEKNTVGSDIDNVSECNSATHFMCSKLSFSCSLDDQFGSCSPGKQVQWPRAQGTAAYQSGSTFKSDLFRRSDAKDKKNVKSTKVLHSKCHLNKSMIGSIGSIKRIKVSKVKVLILQLSNNRVESNISL